MSTNVSNVLTHLMKTKGLTSAELARLTGVVQPVLYRIASGETDNPKIATLIPIANFFGITIDQLIGIESRSKTSSDAKNVGLTFDHFQAPLLNWSQIASWPHVKKDQINSYITPPSTTSSSAFAIQILDTAMAPRFSEGTTLIFDPTLSPKNLDFILLSFTRSEEISLKQLIIDGPDKYLKPINPELRTIFVDSTQKLNIFGVLTESITSFRK